MGRGIECGKCGANTPLPDDLRIPTFACAFCNAQLQTVTYVGETARAADEMRAFFQRVVQQSHDVGTAPRLPSVNRGESRPGKCRRCAAPVEVSLDLHVKQVTCAACSDVAPITAYISDAERLQLDMARQIAGNDALRKLRVEGLACGRCGGRNPVPDDGAVQITCLQCAQPILLADHVDKDALARSRLKHAAMELRAGLQTKSSNDKRTNLIVFCVVFGLIAVVAAIVLVVVPR